MRATWSGISMSSMGMLGTVFLILAGCANSVAGSSSPADPSRVQRQTFRVIATFDPVPVAGDGRAMSLVTELCSCAPVFIRQYLGNAMIYEVSLPPEMSYDVFARTLLEKGSVLGIRAVEQDSVQRLERAK